MYECINIELQATELGKVIYKTLGFIEHGTIDVYQIKKLATTKPMNNSTLRRRLLLIVKPLPAKYAAESILTLTTKLYLIINQN